MSDASDATPQRPTSIEDRTGWRAYWAAQGTPWRTEPEIDAERQRYLAERRNVIPVWQDGSFPFGGTRLSRADVEWLVVTDDARVGAVKASGTVYIRGATERARREPADRTGLDLRGADLRKVDLSNLPLGGMLGGLREDEYDVATIEQEDMAAVHLERANLRQADLRSAILLRAHLAEASLGSADLQYATLVLADLKGADLWRADLRQADLQAAHLEGAFLREVQLAGATLNFAHLEGAILQAAHLNADLVSEQWFLYRHSRHKEKATVEEWGERERAGRRGTSVRRRRRASVSELALRGTVWTVGSVLGIRARPSHEVDADDGERPVRQYPNQWFVPSSRKQWYVPVDLRHAHFDSGTQLAAASLGDKRRGFALIADLHWGGADLSGIDWTSIEITGDEQWAREIETGSPISEVRANRQKARANQQRAHSAAIRSCRQLAIALRSQGLNDVADRFGYRALVLQRKLLRRRFRLIRYFGSVLLDLTSGYGYKPLRSLTAYVLIICLFAGAYLLNAQFAAPHLTWDESLVLSISSFHGRGFFTTGVSLGDTLARLAAGEAIIGLLIEITFIATFTQRFFAR